MFQEHKSAASVAYGVALVSGQEFEPFKLTITSPGSFKGQFVRAGKGQSTVQTKKQKKGGQSAQRFGRIRQEKRGVWVQKVVESLDAAYLDKDGRPTIKGLVLAGPSTLKQELMSCVEGCNSGLLPLLGSAVHLFPTNSIDTPDKQTRALASVQAQMPTFFASAQHNSDEARWAEFVSASERGGAAYGEREVAEALAKCCLRLVLVCPTLQGANLDKWDTACLEAGAIMCVLSSPTAALHLTDYGGIVGLPWFGHAQEVDEDFEVKETEEKKVIQDSIDPLVDFFVDPPSSKKCVSINTKQLRSWDSDESEEALEVSPLAKTKQVHSWDSDEDTPERAEGVPLCVQPTIFRLRPSAEEFVPFAA